MAETNKKTEVASTTDDFEKKIASLSAVVDKLEGDVSLEEGMKLFGSGLELIEDCIAELDKAREGIAELKGRLDIILGRGGNGDE